MPTAAAIITAATTLFMDAGYRAVTMDMVGEPAGVTKATVYYHFPDKTSLFVATSEHVFSQARQASQRVLAQNGPLRSRLYEIARIVLGLPRPFTSFDVMLHEALAELSPEQLGQVRAAQHSVDAVIEQAFRDASSRGEIATVSPTLAAHAFIALLRLGQTRNEAGDLRFPEPEAAAAQVIALLWNGIAPD